MECDGRGSIPIDGAGGGLQLSSWAGFTVLLRQWFQVTNAYWAQALLTPYGAPDCRSRYAEGPGDAPPADSAGYHLDNRGLPLPGQPAGSAHFLAVRLRLLQTRLGAAAGGHQLLVGHPGGEAGQGIAQERLRRVGVGIQVLGPGLFVTGQAANPHPAPLQIVGCCPWCPASAARCGRWTPQPRRRPGPAGSPESAIPAGCWYRRFRRRRRPDRCEKAPRQQPASAGVGFPGRCPPTPRLWGGWCGRSRRSRESLSLQLVRIALYLCDLHPNKLKGGNCGPVSQTRVCEPPQPERFIHTDRSRADQMQVQRPPCSGVTSGVGWQDSTAGYQRCSAHTVHLYLCFGGVNLPPKVRSAADRCPLGLIRPC